MFGIRQLYPAAPSGAQWTSEHWGGGRAYTIAERVDSHDPHRSSGMRGNGTLSVTGTGELVMRGSQPRLYVYPTTTGAWRNLEITVYYQRVADDDTPWAGLVIGARSGPDGHATTPCDAHTYYSRLRHDGSTDFEKELMHPSSATRGTVPAAGLWAGTQSLPFKQWIGWKFVVYTRAADGTVKLESYRDLTGGKDGGTWDLVNETVDRGGWFAPTSCSEHQPFDNRSDLACLRAGVAFIRDTGVTEAHYRWLTVREISPAT